MVAFHLSHITVAEMDTINTSTLQMRKLELRKVKKLAEGHWLVSGRCPAAGFQHKCAWLLTRAVSLQDASQITQITPHINAAPHQDLPVRSCS